MKDRPAPAPSTAPAGLSPAASLLANLRAELARYAPFSAMAAADIDFFITHSTQQYFAPGETLLAPAAAAVRELFLVRQGTVTREHGMSGGSPFQFEPGDIFPVSAAMAQRPVTASYRATADTFVLALPVAALHALAARSAVFADYLNRRILQFLDVSRAALQASYSAHTLAGQSMETPLGDLSRRTPVTCEDTTPLQAALTIMHERRIGSLLVTGESGALVGILTRHDLLGRIVLAGVALDRPISDVMVRPVHTLTCQHTAEDAALLMSRHGIRHVPVTRDGTVVGMVSERDLFALQRFSLKQVGSALRSAADIGALQQAAGDIRQFASGLLAQGVQARQITALISHLNDLLTERLLHLLARQHGVDMGRLCWLALGSEGRSEQTIATDQDNALILRDDMGETERTTVLAFAQAVNVALDACGYPLCKGGVMAGNPDCCLSLAQWRARFAGWIQQGAPQDLLNASIYFDFRALAGDSALAQALRTDISETARSTPRFLKQLAVNALTRQVALGWLGGIAPDARGRIDLKLQGTAVIVDAARVYAMAQGIEATSTRERLISAGPLLGVPATEYEAWVAGFEFLQMLRLRVQLEGTVDAEQANQIDVASLNDIDRRILKESLRMARAVQQRMALDYER